MTTDDLVAGFLARVDAEASMTPERRAILSTLVNRLVELVAFDPDDSDLKVAATVLDELLDAANVFSPWRSHPKFTVFGSARTKPGTALYDMARDLAAEMRQRGWITVSGAGPGIMEAAALGAGRDNTLGVNIDLPFEQSPNPYVDAETRLVEMKYFFTRKVALTKESIAFCIFPGGLGTMDETFEVLTLLHTGKSTPAPVVLCDVADGTYWEEWRAFMDSAVIAAGYLDEPDTVLFRVCHSIDGAIAEIERFYSNFVGVEVVDGEALVSLRRRADARAGRARGRGGPGLRRRRRLPGGRRGPPALPLRPAALRRAAPAHRRPERRLGAAQLRGGLGQGAPRPAEPALEVGGAVGVAVAHARAQRLVGGVGHAVLEGGDRAGQVLERLAHASVTTSSSPAAWRARSTFLSNLPTLVLGTASTKHQCSGSHHLATLSARYGAQLLGGRARRPR